VVCEDFDSNFSLFLLRVKPRDPFLSMDIQTPYVTINQGGGPRYAGGSTSVEFPEVIGCLFLGFPGSVETLKKCGGQGGAPLGLPPPLEERGGHPPNSRLAEVNHKKLDFNRAVFPCKSHSSGMMMGVETPIPPDTMNTAAPEGAPPRRFNDLKEKCRKPSCPAVPHRGPEAGDLRIIGTFHTVCMNPIVFISVSKKF
jgi:hypothetical protein